MRVYFRLPTGGKSCLKGHEHTAKELERAKMKIMTYCEYKGCGCNVGKEETSHCAAAAAAAAAEDDVAAAAGDAYPTLSYRYMAYEINIPNKAHKKW